IFFFSSRRRHTRFSRDWSSDVCSSDLISRAITPEGVVDIFAAAGLEKPDISIPSDEFLAEVRGMPQRNLAVELLRKLLEGELKKIGRASCRERGWVGGVAAAL